MKNLWDRLLPYHASHAPRSLQGKRAILIASAADDDPSCFDGLRFAMRHSCALLGMPVAFEWCVPGLWETQDANNRLDLLQTATTEGYRLFQ